MSEENVEFVRRRFGAALEGDWETALAKLDPKVEIHDFDLPDAGVYHGHDGFRAWLERWSDGWESWRMDAARATRVLQRPACGARRRGAPGVGGPLRRAA